jgi:hypothetical protein
VPISHPPFELARLHREPITRVTTGSHPVVRGRIQIPVRTCSLDAYVKLLPERAFIVESVCAWLAQYLGLPTPDAFWVTVHRQRMHGFWPFGNDEDRLCFGTAALPFAQAVRLESQSPSVLATMYGLDPTLLARIALFDELIGNDDRHDGNLLLTARREIRLIDHERAIGGTGLGLFSTVPPPGPNRLLQMVHKFSPTERAALKAPLREFCAACHAAVFRLPYAQLVSDEALREPVRVYLERRAEQLLDTLGQTLGIPDLPGLQPRPLQPPAL